ncbi:MAG: ATPase, T2SS/T4P/T4SS family [Desulfovermiculus sp.]|nr:ATPase, T2SS/T4P/T4SS family [Desulfovermiculus sp.]
MDTRSIGQRLQRRYGLGQDQIADIKQLQRTQGISLLRAAFELGILASEDYVRFAASEYRLPIAQPQDLQAPEEVQRILSLDVCRKYKCIPFQRQGQYLYLALAEPDDILAQDDIRFMTGLEVLAHVAAPNWIQAALDRLDSHGDGQFQGVSETLAQFHEQDLTWAAQDHKRAEETSLLEEANQGPVVKMVNVLIMDAIRKKASDIHIESYEKLFRVRYRLDGVLREIMRPPVGMRAALISRIKIMANLDIAEKRLPQDGRIKVRTPGGSEAEFRVSILPTLFGEKIVLRYLDASALQMDMLKLGLESDTMGVLKKIVHSPHGIFLVTGPTGSGKTTTLYSVLKELNTEKVNIATVEDPVELTLTGVNQVQIKESIGLSFSSALRSFLRQDPDIILVGEVRDAETAQIAVKAALTGHLVLSTLHTNDAPSTINRLINLGVEGFMLASALRGIMAQRLVRTLCPECKGKAAVDQGLLHKLGVEPERGGEICEPVGCAQCHQSGYKGRTGVYECLEVTPAMQGLIENQAGLPEIRKQALEEGLHTLRQSAVNKLVQGLTSVEEVVRLTVDE